MRFTTCRAVHTKKQLLLCNTFISFLQTNACLEIRKTNTNNHGIDCENSSFLDVKFENACLNCSQEKSFVRRLNKNYNIPTHCANSWFDQKIRFPRKESGGPNLSRVL